MMLEGNIKSQQQAESLKGKTLKESEKGKEGLVSLQGAL